MVVPPNFRRTICYCDDSRSGAGLSEARTRVGFSLGRPDPSKEPRIIRRCQNSPQHSPVTRTDIPGPCTLRTVLNTNLSLGQIIQGPCTLRTVLNTNLSLNRTVLNTHPSLGQIIQGPCSLRIATGHRQINRFSFQSQSSLEKIQKG